ncbi:GAF domain-containing protein [Vitiosangium sp. GDMCC 1.1324]|uniref:GAF domain-containing protein n=1 Tax=Vitiosangium sp. (strain GDMCC 1.1324) TaxID=2138576 RepID=UPI001E52A7CB|nr:GAF domain-containing protein [Vitiosangium sp. GDMCC 1.1324]
MPEVKPAAASSEPARKPEVTPASGEAVVAPPAASAPASAQAAPAPEAPKEAPPTPAAAPEPEKRAPSPVAEAGASAAPAKEPAAPVSSVQATPAAPKPSRAAPVQPVELPSAPAGELEVASPLDHIGSGAGSSWSRRAIEVDFSSQDVSSTDPGAFPEGELQLASVHEFIPTWDPSAEPAASAPESAEAPAETFTGWDDSPVGGPEGTPDGNAASAPQVPLQDALEALRQATTRGELGKVLLSYAQGRFPRGFLLGETFGIAKVGRGYGPGSNKPEVSALQVDLEAPSLLAMAAAGGRAVVSSVPESPEDETLFAALGESFSHLVAAPIRVQQRTVGFVVIDGGPSPFGAEELDDLESLVGAASEAYGRLTESLM